MSGANTGDDPRLSVVLPVRNGEATLDRCLQALEEALAHAGLSGGGAEVIVADDGSTDATRQIASRHPVRVLSPAPGKTGAAAARNAGADAAKGEILLFLDADVLVEPQTVARLLDRLGASPRVDAAIGVYAPCDPGLGPWSRAKDLAVRLNHARSGDLIRWFWTAVGAVRGTAFEAAGGFDEARFQHGATVEDMDLGFRLSGGGHPIAQVSEARARHLHRFDLAGLVLNDFKKSRAWAGVLVHNRGAATESHGATRGGEALALICASVALGGTCATALAPGAALPVAAAGWLGLAWLLRAHLRQAAAENGAFEALTYLGVRALLYPVAAAGAALGIVGAMLSGRPKDEG